VRGASIRLEDDARTARLRVEVSPLTRGLRLRVQGQSRCPRRHPKLLDRQHPGPTARGEPVPDGAAPFGWRYGRTVALGPDQGVSPLAAPAASILVADLLP